MQIKEGQEQSIRNDCTEQMGPQLGEAFFNYVFMPREFNSEARRDQRNSVAEAIVTMLEKGTFQEKRRAIAALLGIVDMQVYEANSKAQRALEEINNPYRMI
jgi:DNA invertase Pin-like site-specific DNA recombinase